MKSTLFITLILLLIANLQASDKDDIRAIMSIQEQAWNNGDLELFMVPYLHSKNLMFIGKTGIKYGWQTTLDNYKKSYPDKNAMGQLTFELLKIEINGNSAFVLGTWTLTRTQDVLSGYYTLYWKKIEGQWQITIDHSS
jgi:ketosteroid isomerase-like protein